MRVLLIATTVLLAATSVALAQANNKSDSTATKKLGGIEYRTSSAKTNNAETNQYQVDVGKKNDVFLYGETTKIDPGYRQPGQAGLPGNATGEPETRYGLGLGFRF